MTEKYYAIRVGCPKKHKPYFMLGNADIPALFVSKAIAKLRCPPDKYCKVVQVTVTAR